MKIARMLPPRRLAALVATGSRRDKAVRVSNNGTGATPVRAAPPHSRARTTANTMRDRAMGEVMELNSQPAAPRARRLKIWQLQRTFHCSLIGTCLSMRDLRKIANKAKMKFPEGFDEYSIHAVFVQSVATASPVAKLLNKFLDKKYHAEIGRCKKLGDADDLLPYWKGALEAGEIPGPYWAAMIHPFADDRPRAALFGDVHMLSHLVGAANRADVRRLKTLEEERDRFAATCDAERTGASRIIKQRRHEVDRLKAKLADRVDSTRRAAGLAKRLELLENGQVLRTLKQRLQTAVQRAEIEHRKAAGARQSLARNNSDIAALRDNFKTLQESLSAACGERDALERILEQGLGKMCSRCGMNMAASPQDGLSLEGANIVYVGGRTAQIGHFRMLVENAGGRFLHHDGGIEDGTERLEGVLVKGDVVLCPIDCVSHSACRRAKTFCKRMGKSFVPLRTSGLSAFVAGLRDVSNPS